MIPTLKSIQQILRNVQDQNRDAGWRIPWIPWQTPGRPETVYNTPLTISVQLVGIALFLGGPGFLFLSQSRSMGWLVFSVLGWALILFARVYAAWHKQRDWIYIEALCLDREIRLCRNACRPSASGVWEFRLLCEFSIAGKTFRVTPEQSRITAFRSKEEAEKHLEKFIMPNGSCRLWVRPGNPLQASFPERRSI